MKRLASLRRVGWCSFGALGLTVPIGFWYRPEVDLSDGYWVHTKDRRIPVPDGGVWWEAFRSSRALSPRSPDEADPLVLRAARWLVIMSVSLVFRTALTMLNTFEVDRDQHFARLLQLVESRPPGSALITVSNHSSTIDDPTLLVASMPWRVLIDTSKIRWVFCTQDICFRRPILAGIASAGKVLPIKKGGGIDQPLLAEVQRRIAQGCWLHIFPEGKVNQCRQLGIGHYDNRTATTAAEIGRMKWGVGKLVAHSPVPVTLIPLHHVGMDDILVMQRQPPYSLDLGSSRLGRRVRLIVGEEIRFLDLVQDHERVHGELRKFDVSEGEARLSSAAEKMLYSKITRRVEDALLTLEQRGLAAWTQQAEAAAE
mmetsp:Transcript_64122/g.171645  ORF Transcript_64122/g.171645 Transcript_64122/m.171645 type:complete len:370 (-) Transcript_64122:220-1329(-)